MRSSAFWVCKDEFPTDLSNFDGVLISGSPASVADAAPWMLRLEDLVRDLIESGVPIFGACFGHQIIARALGAPIIRNPQGWSHGLIEITRVNPTQWSRATTPRGLYGSHIEQVGTLPRGATHTFESPGCPIAGFAIGDKVFTVQHHPEMTREFISDLIEEYADYVGDDVTTHARMTVAEGTASRTDFATEIATFFEQAVQ